MTLWVIMVYCWATLQVPHCCYWNRIEFHFHGAMPHYIKGAALLPCCCRWNTIIFYGMAHLVNQTVVLVPTTPVCWGLAGKPQVCKFMPCTCQYWAVLYTLPRIKHISIGQTAQCETAYYGKQTDETEHRLYDTLNTMVSFSQLRLRPWQTHVLYQVVMPASNLLKYWLQYSKVDRWPVVSTQCISTPLFLSPDLVAVATGWQC